MTDTPGNFPKISPAHIEAKLTKCVFEVDQPEGRTSTFVHVYDEMGYFLATGHSACVDPRNFNAQKGIEYAQQDALGKADNKLWELEGYALKKDLQAGRYILRDEERQLPEFIQRLIVERNELAGRLSNLSAYLNSDKSKALPEEQRTLLYTKATLQTSLLEVLDRHFALIQQG